MARVQVLDPRPVVRLGLVGVLSDAGIEVVASDAPDRGLDAAVVGGGDTEALRTVVASGVPVVAFVRAGTSDAGVAAQLDCRGIVPESASVDELVALVRTVIGGGYAVHADLVRGLALPLGPARPDAARATPRELAVLELVAEGLTNDGIADRLGVAPSTVKTHLDNVFAKFGVGDRAHAVAEAFRRGMLG